MPQAHAAAGPGADAGGEDALAFGRRHPGSVVLDGDGDPAGVRRHGDGDGRRRRRRGLAHGVVQQVVQGELQVHGIGMAMQLRLRPPGADRTPPGPNAAGTARPPRAPPATDRGGWRRTGSHPATSRRRPPGPGWCGPCAAGRRAGGRPAPARPVRRRSRPAAPVRAARSPGAAGPGGYGRPCPAAPAGQAPPRRGRRSRPPPGGAAPPSSGCSAAHSTRSMTPTGPTVP